MLSERLGNLVQILIMACFFVMSVCKINVISCRIFCNALQPQGCIKSYLAARSKMYNLEPSLKWHLTKVSRLILLEGQARIFYKIIFQNQFIRQQIKNYLHVCCLKIRNLLLQCTFYCLHASQLFNLPKCNSNILWDGWIHTHIWYI